MDPLYDHVYTMENIIAYSHRLHYNTALDIIINGIAAYVVLKHSTTAMGIYKYYILLTIVCAFIMDFHITFIFGPYFMLPSTVLCGSSFIALKLGLFWGRIFNFFLMHITFSSVGWSIVFGLLYQYSTLNGNAELFFHKPLGFIVIGLTMVLYPLPAYVVIATAFDRNKTVEYIKENYANSFDLFLKAPCHAVILDAHGKSYYGSLAGIILLVYAFGIIVALKIHWKLFEMKSVLSKTTLKAKRQLLWALVFQATIPFSFIVFPIVFMAIVIIFQIPNTNVFTDYALPVLSLHSTANALSVMIMITPYRRALISGFKTVFRMKSRINPPIFEATSHSINMTVSKRPQTFIK